MELNEYVGHIHLHTTHSDGTATHQEIARIANRVGLDFVIPTDHNVLVKGMDGWYENTLLLVGEEIHDVEREPQVNHYLAFNIEEDVFEYAKDPQALVDAVNAQGGFGFIAHPFEHSTPFSGEPEIPWIDWGVRGYAGLEIWNYMSEFKAYLPNLAQAFFLVYFPQAAIRAPFPETLAKWDELLRGGKMAAIGGSDGHAKTYHLGPLSREVFSYEYLFRASRTHILTEEAFSGELEHDKRVIYEALREGRCFVAYDLLGNSAGFRFTARSGGAEAGMGEEIALKGKVEFRVSSPQPAEIRLLHHGRVIKRARGKSLRHVVAGERGAYRLEAYRRHLFRKRGWVFTNPIYVK